VLAGALSGCQNLESVHNGGGAGGGNPANDGLVRLEVTGVRDNLADGRHMWINLRVENLSGTAHIRSFDYIIEMHNSTRMYIIGRGMFPQQSRDDVALFVDRRAGSYPVLIYDSLYEHRSVAGAWVVPGSVSMHRFYPPSRGGCAGYLSIGIF
jgi:hypothetical protein